MKQFFSESNGELSMKRLVGFICTVSLCVPLIRNPNDALIIMVGGLAGAALGMTSAEKIFKRK